MACVVSAAVVALSHCHFFGSVISSSSVSQNLHPRADVLLDFESLAVLRVDVGSASVQEVVMVEIHLVAELDLLGAKGGRASKDRGRGTIDELHQSLIHFSILEPELLAEGL